MKNIERNKEYEPEVLEKLHNLQLEMLKDLQQICDKYDLQYFAVFGTALGAVRHGGFIPWDDDIDVGMLRKDYDIFIRVVEKEMGDKYQIMTPEIDKNYACCVTKFQRKGTKFISYFSDKLDCEQCIFIDIFPFDYIAKTKKKAKRQQLITLFFDRLIYLCGSAHPIIPYTGVKYYLAAGICWCTHYITKLFHLSPKIIYQAFVKQCTKNNMQNTDRVTSFGDGSSLKYHSTVSKMFPLKEIPFENMTIKVMNNNDEHLRRTYGDYMTLPPVEQRVNHAPYIIEFGNIEEKGTKKNNA